MINTQFHRHYKDPLRVEFGNVDIRIPRALVVYSVSNFKFKLAQSFNSIVYFNYPPLIV